MVLSSLKKLLETGQALSWTTTREGWREKARGLINAAQGCDERGASLAAVVA